MLGRPFFRQGLFTSKYTMMSVLIILVGFVFVLHKSYQQELLSSFRTDLHRTTLKQAIQSFNTPSIRADRPITGLNLLEDTNLDSSALSADSCTQGLRNSFHFVRKKILAESIYDNKTSTDCSLNLTRVNELG